MQYFYLQSRPKCDNIIIVKDREEITKMVEKNLKKELDKRKRVWYNMNTGTISHKDAKHPSRAKRKENFKKMLDNEKYL